ncbi:alpha/beta superfamily hydrolase [gamma proteobacterium HTCC5015]|nr:alpha/beta superfamily hydrolase [gamma proteobacterium HTCC5015]
MKHLVFSHGLESGPWGTKIRALAEVAKAQGWRVDSLDYRGEYNPEARVQQLVEYCRSDDRYRRAARRVLVGSSMGGYVSTVAAQELPASLRPDGLFLLAPAFYMGPYKHQQLTAPAQHIEIVHGWRDDVVPFENSLRYARQHECALHMVDDEHRLIRCLPAIQYYLKHSLATVSQL